MLIDAQEEKARRIVVGFGLGLFTLTWVLLFVFFLNTMDRRIGKAFSGPLDAAKRLTAPDRSKTAILARSYQSSMDMNFVLFISDDEYVDLSDPGPARFLTTNGDWIGVDSVQRRRSLWISHDFESTTGRDWGEAIQWSGDSQVVVVWIDGEPIYAYDFVSKQGYEDLQRIEALLSAH